MKIRISKKPFRGIGKWIEKNPEKPLIYSLWVGLIILSIFGVKHFLGLMNSFSTNLNWTNNLTENQTLQGTIQNVVPISTGVLSNFFSLTMLAMGGWIVFKFIRVFQGSFYEGSGL